MRKVLLLLMGLFLMLALAGCGQKSEVDVVGALSDKVKELKGYKTEAKMTLKMGTEPQEYSINIWHQSPSYYRVNLKNGKKDQSQIILRNQDGVYVLTPALNKSFKFQSEWPKNSSQAYLYESLVQDVLEDKNATFKETDKSYIFTTKTRYQNNKMLPMQQVSFDKKSLAPKKVQVMDSDKNILVLVEFGKTNFDPSFGKGAFDVKKNMTAGQLEVPVMADAQGSEFTVKYPTAELQGVANVGDKLIVSKSGDKQILTYEGEGKSFTLIEEKAKVIKEAASIVEVGEPVDLGFTIGSMTDTTVSWTYEGVNFMLASTSLSMDEMLMVARSVEGVPVK